MDTETMDYSKPIHTCTFIGVERVPSLVLSLNPQLEYRVEVYAVPTPELVCPVCGVEHELEVDTLDQTWSFEDAEKDCIFYYAEFNGRDQAIEAMKNLIKAMESK